MIWFQIPVLLSEAFEPYVTLSQYTPIVIYCRVGHRYPRGYRSRPGHLTPVHFLPHNPFSNINSLCWFHTCGFLMIGWEN